MLINIIQQGEWVAAICLGAHPNSKVITILHRHTNQASEVVFRPGSDLYHPPSVHVVLAEIGLTSIDPDVLKVRVACSRIAAPYPECK